MATDDSRPPVTGYPAPPPETYAGNPPTHAYAAPPPQYINSNYQTNPPPPLHRRSDFLPKLLIVIIASFIIIGTLILGYWLLVFIFRLSVRPHSPVFRVDSVAVTNFSAADSQHVSGTWRIGFRIANPNKKMKIYYSALNAALFYKSEFIADTWIWPFGQATGNETALDATVNAASAYVAWSAMSGMNSDRDRGSVPFRVRIFAWARLSPRGWREVTTSLRVWCDDLAVGLTSSSNGAGKLVGAARECSVRL